MRAAVLSVVVVVVAACASSKPPAPAAPANRPEPTAPVASASASAPAPRDDDARFEAMMARAMALYRALGDAAEAGGNDCGKIAAGLEAVIDANLEFFAEAKRLQEDEAMKARGERWVQAHMPEIQANLTRFMTAVQGCVQDPAFMEVMTRLQAKL